MKRREEYEDLQKETVSLRKYFYLLFTSLIIIIGILNIPIEDSYPGKLIQISENQYETYLSSTTLTEVSKGSVFEAEKRYKYQVQEVEEMPLAEENNLFYLVKIKLEEKQPFPILSGKFMISKKTLFEKIKIIWEEKMK